MEFKGVMGGFYRISEWIMRLSVINVLWVVCSIPFFYLGLVGLFSGSEAFMQSLVLLGIVAPFTLFPATAAMFMVARKWVSGEEDVPLLKTFFRGYKENYVQSMVGGILFIIIILVLVTNYKFYLTQSGVLRLLSILFITFSFIFMAALINFFSIMVHLHMKVLQIIKSSFLITIGNPINSIILIICNGIIVYISTRFTFLIPFFMGSLMATFSFWQFYRSFLKLQLKQQQLAEAEGEQNQVSQTNELSESMDKLSSSDGLTGNHE